MKVIIENSAYLLVMSLICLLSIDFIMMNMRISKVNEVEQYIEDYIEIYGEVQENNSLDESLISSIADTALKNDMTFDYEYQTQTETHAYYRIHIAYSLKSSVFRLGKTHQYEGMVRVAL